MGHDATEEGANAFLTKFLSSSELLATVEPSTEVGSGRAPQFTG